MRAGGGSARGRPADGAACKDKAGEQVKKKGGVEPGAETTGHGEQKVEYRMLYDVPECPVFHPTAKEFTHPGKYIESISEQVQRFGICKIVPPPSWKPPFMIDRKNFTVRTRVQQVNYLDGQARQRLIFVENLCRFWSKRGQELEKLPVIAQAPLDVCRLYHEVRLRGGMSAVVEKKLWSEVARAMDMESSHGSALRTQYAKMLLPYEEWKESIGEYRVQAESPEEEDEEEVALRREREKRLHEERERRRKRKERMAFNEVEEGKPTRLTRGRAKGDGGLEEEHTTFTTAAGVIGIGSKVSVFWDGDGVSYKGVVVRTCERQGCMVTYDADGETHWEDPESIRLLGTGDCGGDGMDDGNDEGDLPMLDSLGGQGALASLDTCLEAGARLSAAAEPVVKTEIPSPSKDAGDSRAAGIAMGSGHAIGCGVDAEQSANVNSLAAVSGGKRFQQGYGQALEGSGSCGSQDKIAKEEEEEDAESGIKMGMDVTRRETLPGENGAGACSGGSMGDVSAENLAGVPSVVGQGQKSDGQGADDDDENEDDEYRFGYHDGQSYSLQGFRKMANEWKEAHFDRSLKKISEEDVEEDYWRIICTPETPINVEYGSELHTTQHGSGFPTHGNALNPLDCKTSSSYCRSGWNLNNLNECTLLRFVKEDIPGIISPWLYMGMCFSSFCWHNEDHFLYSINYLWEGDPKQWYGVPGDEADLFEATLREYAPQLFELQPDVLFQLVTMIAPSVLREKGVHVCRARQRAGEFMVTFPRAYHGGFNMGYNVAESCNFALTDWIPWGLMSDRWYRELGRAQVFSHPGLLVSLAQDSDTVETAMWLLSDLERYVALEQQGVHALLENGLRTRRRMETTAGILTNMLSANSENEAPNTMLDGKRLCAGRMKMSNMSMQDIRRQRESQGQDECCICLGSTFLFLVRCSCSDRRVSCVAHAHRMCSCDMASKSLEERFSDEQLAHLVADVRQLAERPAIWMGQVAEILSASSRGNSRPQARTLQGLVTEAERFPRALSMVWQQQEKLKDVLRQTKAWSSQAQAMLQEAKKSESKGRTATKENLESSILVGDIQKLIQDADELKAIPDDLEALQGLLVSVISWRDRCRAVMQANGQQGLRDLDDASLQQLLADGRALHVQMPELRKVIHESDLRIWISALPPIPGSCAMCRVQELVAEADAKKLQSTQVDTVRRALELADMTRSRLQKARGRGTSVAALKSLLQDIVKDKQRQQTGLIVELEEEEEIRKTLQLCDEWNSRAVSTLAEGCLGGTDSSKWNADGRPWLKQLEQLQEEYLAIGVYIEACEPLRRRIETAQTWRRKALRIAPAVFAPARSAALECAEIEVEEGESGPDKAVVGVEAQAAAAGCDGGVGQGASAMGMEEHTARVSGAEEAGAPREDVEGPSSGSKRGMEQRERETKRQRKGGRGDPTLAGNGTVASSGISRVMAATRTQVLELLEEESKLHVRVDEAEILRSRLKEMADWSEGALKLLSDASAAVQEFQGLVAARVAEGGLNSQDERAQKALAYGIKMSAALANGEALGLELEEEGRKMKECLWVLGVGKLLAADAQRQREQLLRAQAQASLLNVSGDSPMLVALKASLKILEAQGCICGSSAQGKSAMLSCVSCGKVLHTECMGVSPTDPRVSSSANSYLCAPCRRKGATMECSAVWTQGETPVSLKLPAGWWQTMDQMGSSVFLQRSVDGSILQAVGDPPVGSSYVIPCPPNPCLSRAEDSARLCQVCFEVDDVPDIALREEGADGSLTDETAKLAKLAREAAQERGQLLQCLECGVCVHDGCYGGPPRKTQDAAGTSPAPFLCRPCEYGVRNARCVLCDVVGGAFSPATCGGWAHVSCALWAPVGSGVDFEKLTDGLDETALKVVAEQGERLDGAAKAGMTRRKGARVVVPESFKNGLVAKGKDGKDARDARRRSSTATCQFCPNSRGGGVLVRCQEKGCKLAAHPVCGFEHGWYLFLDTGIIKDAEDEQAEGDADDGKTKGRRAKGGSRTKKRAQRKDERPELGRLVFCHEHAPHEEDEDDTLYCICQRRYQEGEWMIECEGCKGWFHGHCVGVKESESDALVDWHCPKCRQSQASEEPARGGAPTAQEASSTGIPVPQAADLHLLLNFAGGRGT